MLVHKQVGTNCLKAVLEIYELYYCKRSTVLPVETWILSLTIPFLELSDGFACYIMTNSSRPLSVKNDKTQTLKNSEGSRLHTLSDVMQLRNRVPSGWFVSCRVVSGRVQSGDRHTGKLQTVTDQVHIMDCEKLVYCVFERRSLWDHRDKMYYNREAKRRLWSEVAARMGKSSKYYELQVQIYGRFLG